MAYVPIPVERLGEAYLLLLPLFPPGTRGGAGNGGWSEEDVAQLRRDLRPGVARAVRIADLLSDGGLRTGEELSAALGEPEHALRGGLAGLTYALRELPGRIRPIMTRHRRGGRSVYAMPEELRPLWRRSASPGRR